MGTRNLLNIIRKVKPGIYIFTSSAAAYTEMEGPISEDTPYGPIDLYSMTKVVGEDLVNYFIYNAYGPNDTNPHVIPETIRQLKSGSRELELGNIEAKRDFIHFQDVVDAI